MNLDFLLAKRDGRLIASGGITPGGMRVHGEVWRGISFPAGQTGSLEIRAATECHPFRTRASDIGWYAFSVGGPASLILAFRSTIDGQPVGQPWSVTLTEAPQPIRIPWPEAPVLTPLDLVITRTDSGSGILRVAVHRVHDRSKIIEQCRGKGVELGPGLRPQILPSEEVDVFYVEQTDPSEWTEKYAQNQGVEVDPSLRGRYVIGDAHHVPAPPRSLDFIFSSHVFEHLANPLGHLALWAGLLKPGGVVAMVIPDHIGTKDYLVDASSMQEIIAEYSDGSFDLSERHYERFAISRAQPALKDKLMKENHSIHVHYYTNINMAEICQWAVAHLGYAMFGIIHCRNNKDFHVVLVRG